MELSGLRKDYSDRTLRKRDLSLNPFEQFTHWFHEASSLIEHNAMQLATSSEGRPSLRTLLLKYFDSQGFIFYTSYHSRKAQELEKNPYCSLLFYWKELEKQVIIEGKAQKISPDQSAAYFASRPRSNQLAAHASSQSQALTTREELDARYHALEKQFNDQKIPLPTHWGGYLVIPTRFEFWQGRPHRLHDRFQYTLKNSTWHLERLNP